MIAFVTLGTNKFDEGVPGTRSGNFYAGYFRDLDGNKLNAFCMAQEQE